MTTATGAFRHYAKAPKESVAIIRTQKGNHMWVNRQHSVYESCPVGTQDTSKTDLMFIGPCIILIVE